MVRLHPHFYVAFNRFIGGLPGAYGNYDTDYYGETYKESIANLADHLWETDRENYLSGKYVVATCGNSFQLERYFPPPFFEEKGDRRQGKFRADFYLGYTRGKCDERPAEAPILLEVKRDGTRLNVARDARALRAAQKSKPQKKKTNRKIGKRPGTGTAARGVDAAEAAANAARAASKSRTAETAKPVAGGK
jgi:hypothetical protein